MHGICIPFFVYRELNGLAAFYAGDRFAIFEAAFDCRDVAQINGSIRDVGNDRVAKFFFVLKLIQGTNEKSLIAFFEPPARKIYIFRADAFCDLSNTDTELRQLLLVNANLDFIFEATADFDGGRSFFGLKISLNAILRQAPQGFEPCLARLSAGLVLIQEAQSDYGLGRRIETQQKRAAGFKGQHQNVELFTHIHTGGVHVRAPKKFNCDVRLSGTRNRSDQSNVSYNTDGFLDRFCQEVFNLNRRGAG